jgi:hypothetical protein
VLLLTGFCVGAEAAEPNNLVAPDVGKWRGWWELGGVYGSDQTSRGETTVFAPITQTGRNMLFLDAKGKFFENDIREGNFALGYRQMMSNGFNLGGWLGADIRETSLNNTFWQFSGGVEALSENYDFRANFYIPLTDPKAGGAGFTQIVLQGNNIAMVGGQEVALGGVDAEAGIRVPLERFGTQSSNMELRAYGGGYYFQDNDAANEIAGGKARLELRFPDIFEAMPGSQLTAGYEFTYDDVRKDRHQAGIKLRIPFGNIPGINEEADTAYSLAALDPQERRMLDGLVRDTDIVTTQSAAESVIDNATNVALNRVAYANDAAGLQAAVGQGANTHIIVQDNGTPIDLTSTVGVPLQADQTMQGGGSTIALRGATSGAIAPFMAPGGRPTLKSGVSPYRTGVVMLASNTHVAGIETQGGYSGIFGGSSLTNMVVDQNMVSGTRENGIQIVDQNSNFKILYNSLFDIGDDAIDIGSGNSHFAVAHNMIGNAGKPPIQDDGIDFADGNSHFTLANNVIFGTLGAGISGGDGNSYFVAANNVIQNTGGAGISGGDGNSFSALFGNWISQTGQEGIAFGNYNSLVLIAGNRISDTGWEGIYFNDFNDAVFVAGNTIMRTGQDKSNDYQSGIYFDDYNFAVVTGNTIVSPGSNGIEFYDDNLAVIAGNSVYGAGSNGIKLNYYNTVAFGGNYFENIGGDVFHFADSDNELLPGSLVSLLVQGALSSNAALVADARNAALALGISNAEFDGIVSGFVTSLQNPNVVANAPGGVVCFAPFDFFGVLDVLDRGVPRSYVNGCLEGNLPPGLPGQDVGPGL